MNDKKLLFIAIGIIILPLSLAFFGGDKFRYPCQDPDNWGKSECEPPICKVDGACTDVLLGWDPSETTVETIPPKETVAP